MTNDDLYFDTDCISSFLWVKREDILINLFTGKIIVPQQVYNELSNPSVPHLKTKIDALSNNSVLQIRNIDIGSEEYCIYHELAISPPEGEVKIGKGEAAAIALAKVYDGVLASNNLKDISKYVEKYNLKHITTGDILLEAFNNSEITEDEGNTIWSNMLKRKRKLPTKTFTDYINIHKK